MVNNNVVKGPGTLDLAGSIISFPIRFTSDGSEVIAYFHQSFPVTDDEIAQVLSQQTIRYRTMEGGIGRREVQMADNVAAAKFAMRKHIAISGVAGNPTDDQIKAWLERKEHIRMRVFAEGWDGVRPARVDDESAQSQLVIGDDPDEVTIKSVRWLYCPEIDGPVEYRLTHVMTPETSDDWKFYRRAVRIYEQGRDQMVSIDWGAMAKLYKRLVRRLDGVQINGKPCAEENKAEWVERVPLNDKGFAINAQFDRTALKNG